MTADTWFLVIAGLILLLGWAAWVAASRLDRLHRKVAASQAVLDRQLVRRATVAVELASAGLMDPVSSLLVGEAALAALELSGRGTDTLSLRVPDLAELMRETTEASSYLGMSGVLVSADGAGVLPGAALVVDRGLVESELSSTLRAALEDATEVAILREEPGGSDLVDALAAAWYRVQLARRFHNEAVAQTQRARRQRVVRYFRLAGRAPVPEPLEFDDAWPEGLGRPGASAPTPSV
ncbi:hypothetical protein [Pengzhenrongella frigida]|uniref:Uncharacterized protein n=1 Tax=Pengzhenrongella frigida TaxID=1259133 RepID=A0A4Q5N3M6_9MICO|nr:hypothetical protein [Cellulomonas sp. HLT2-17]RYV52838.1 hypothetical protein EUA98_01150 [Cellulomonas sp. HLT2-17]